MFLGRDNFVWWIGVVEENVDPLILGRVKVRIFGYHPKFTPSENLTDGTNKIPISDLPWALVLLSGNNSTTYGRIGLGEWVIGFFLDGADAQEPCVLGVLPSALVEGPVTQAESFGKYFSSLRTFSNITESSNNFPPNGAADQPYLNLLQRRSFISETGHIIELLDGVGDNSIVIGHKDGTTKIILSKDEITVSGKLGTWPLIDQLDWIANGYTDPNGGKIGRRPPPPPPPPPGGGRRRKIICTKLYELGLLSKEIYVADQEFGELLAKSNPDVYNGYVAWAQIVVDWMEGNGPQCMFWIQDETERKKAQQKMSIEWAKKIATPWAVHMAYVMGIEKNDSLTGKILMTIGAPICKVVGFWQRKFGKLQKKPGIFKGYALWATFAFLRLIVLIADLLKRIYRHVRN